MHDAQEKFTNVRSLLGALASAMNLIDPDVTDHHQQTAYLAYSIARELGLPDHEIELTIYASLLHDVGSVLLEYHDFGDTDRLYSRVVSKLGAGMLRGLSFFEEVADIVDYCQLSWTEIEDIMEEGVLTEDTMQVSSIIHLADTVSLMLQNTDDSVLNTAKFICEEVEKQRDTEYCGIVVCHIAFLRAYLLPDLRHCGRHERKQQR